MDELNFFESNLKQRALNNKECKILFATLRAFYHETPSGILCLALRVHDYWDKINTWEAMAKAAYLLSAAVDEFGLDTRKEYNLTHHQHFKLIANYFNVTTEDLKSPVNILEAGKNMGKAAHEFYRKKPIPDSLGFHLASEITSFYEFKTLLEGFQKHIDKYKISSQEDLPLDFFQIHTKIEHSHGVASEIITNNYLKINPQDIKYITDGVFIYMQYYQALFKSLNQVIFSSCSSQK